MSWIPKLKPWQMEFFKARRIILISGPRKTGKTVMMTKRMEREARNNRSFIYIESVKPSCPWWAILGGVVAAVAVLILAWIFLIGVFSQ